MLAYSKHTKEQRIQLVENASKKANNYRETWKKNREIQPK